jgi:hypothetical protein
MVLASLSSIIEPFLSPTGIDSTGLSQALSQYHSRAKRRGIAHPKFPLFLLLLSTRPMSTSERVIEHEAYSEANPSSEEMDGETAEVSDTRLVKAEGPTLGYAHTCSTPPDSAYTQPPLRPRRVEPGHTARIDIKSPASGGK